MLSGAGGVPDVQALIPIVRGMTTLAKFMWPIPDRGLSRRLRRITAPTLLLWGADDALVSARYAEDFAALIPDARKVVLDGAGHMVGIERLDAAVAAVTEFLEEGA
jgi:pimeloyl-ACP methyl ester carboxylesterase